MRKLGTFSQSFQKTFQGFTTTVWKNATKRDRFLRENHYFFRQMNVFINEVTKELFSRDLPYTMLQNFSKWEDKVKK